MSDRSDHVLIGAGGHGRSVWEILKPHVWRPAGTFLYYVDQRIAEWLPSGVERVDLSPFNTSLFVVLKSFGAKHVYLGIGGQNASDLCRRYQLATDLLAVGFGLPRLVSFESSMGLVSDFGDGAQIMPGAVVRNGARIGTAAIINSGAIIEHGAVVEAGAHVAPGAIVLGEAHVGECAMIGAGAVILPGAFVPQGSMVHALERYGQKGLLGR